MTICVTGLGLVTCHFLLTPRTEQKYASGQLRCNTGTIATRPGAKNTSDVQLWCVLSLLHSVGPHLNPLTDQMMTIIFWYEMISMHYKPSHPGLCLSTKMRHNYRLIPALFLRHPSVRQAECSHKYIIWPDIKGFYDNKLKYFPFLAENYMLTYAS